MYVDEVGNADLRSASEPNHRFLSLTGVILSLNTVKQQLHPEFDDLKSKFFDHHPDDPIIFHRKEIVNGKFPFQSLRDQNVRNEFDKELLNIISKTDFTILTVTLDKLEHKNRYITWKYDPYHYCMEALLEAYVLFLYKNKLRGDVLAESRGGKEDRRLKKSFRFLCDAGTKYLESKKIVSVLTSKEIKIKTKYNNIAGLQLADLLAHPSRREILLENKKIDDNRKNIFSEKIVEILKNKYDRQDGKIYGFGKKLLP
jgi:hypothetical protein